jgi:adenylosuccinate synthase
MLNGIERVAVTKLDVLDSFDEILVCSGYEFKGRRLKTFPTDIVSLEHITPIYERFEGWKTPLSSAGSFADLPAQARRYLEAMADLTETKIWLVSVGPRRDQTVTVP